MYLKFPKDFVTIVLSINMAAVMLTSLQSSKKRSAHLLSFAGRRNFFLNKAKKKVFVKNLDPTFRSTRKGKKCFCDEPASV